MKKLISVLCILAMVLFLFPISARADIIYEPMDDFYEQHRDECTRVGRNYTAKGPNGTVTLYTDPVNPGVRLVCDNGAQLYVSYTYQAEDGVIWACCDDWQQSITGWVPMEYLELIYDEQSFMEEFAEQLENVELTLEDPELTGQIVRFWQYPGSRDFVEVLISESNRPAFQYVYTDENGMQWARCGYFMGIKGHWVNLTEPMADYTDLFPDAPEETEAAHVETEASEYVAEIKPAGENMKLTLIVAVAAVMAVTAALLILLKKKK